MARHLNPEQLRELTPAEARARRIELEAEAAAKGEDLTDLYIKGMHEHCRTPAEMRTTPGCLLYVELSIIDEKIAKEFDHAPEELSAAS